MRKSALLLLGLCFCLEGTASAQTTDGSLRLTADLSLFQFTRDRLTPEFGGDVDSQEYSFSLLSNGLGVVLGKNLSESFFLGARVSLAVYSSNGPLSDYSSIDWSMGPQVEYRLSDGVFRPFIQAGATFSTVSDSVLGERQIDRFLGFQVGMGANIFATDTFTIDPRLELGYETQIATTRSTSSSRSRLHFSLQIALSVWLGGEASGSNSTQGSTEAGNAARGNAATPRRVTVIPAEPRFEYARDGERMRAVRMQLQTRTTSLTFTYAPEESVDTVKLELESSNGRPLQSCRSFQMNNVEQQVEAEILSGNVANLSLEELRATTEDRGATNVHFCGRVWRVNNTAARAFRRFLQNTEQSLEQWRAHDAEPAESAAPALLDDAEDVDARSDVEASDVEASDVEASDVDAAQAN